MIPQWKMNGKDMRFDGSIEIGVVEVRDLFDDLVVTLWVDQEESGSIAVKTLGGIGNGRYSVQILSREKPVEEGEEWKEL
tara:strand:- start:196 stop:435 length:240 start_codon:yes stop_codon:yes gene_type:complete